MQDVLTFGLSDEEAKRLGLLNAKHGLADDCPEEVMLDYLKERGIVPMEAAGFSKVYQNKPSQNNPSHYARTLNPSDLGSHPSGWTIEGEVITDYFSWVNEFRATHPEFGEVWGDFEKEVFATSEVGFNHFVENHPPSEWDYWDI